MVTMEGGYWGLVIVASAFFIQLLAFGTAESIGVYNIELLDYFDNDTVGVSLIAAINFALSFGSGPVASYLMGKMSYRKITFLGAVLVVLGVFLMPFLPYIPALCVCFGVLTGIGSCLVFLPSQVLTGLYYDKHRSLATGVATSGSGLGGAVMPIVAGYLIHYYGWKGSLIVLAGLNLNLIVCAAVLRPPHTVNEQEFADPNPKESEGLLLQRDPESTEQRAQTLAGGGVLECPLDINPSVLKQQKNDHSDSQSISSTVSNKNIVLENRSENCFDCLESDDSGRQDDDVLKNEVSHLNPLDAGTLENNGKGGKVLRHLYLFTDFGFCVYFINNILWNITGSINLAFEAEFAVERGTDPLKAAWLSSIGGFCNFLGELLGGLLGDVFENHRLALYLVSNVLYGVSTASFPFGSEYGHFVGMFISAGLSVGVTLGLQTVVLTDIIGPQNLADGFGYLMFANGAGCFIGPALAGYMRKVYGNYDPVFYTAGAVVFSAGVSMLIIPLVKRHPCPKNALRETELDP